MKKFRSSITRKKQQFMQKIGKAEKTADPDFDEAFEDFKNQEKDTKRLNVHIRRFVVSFDSFKEACKSLCLGIDDFYGSCGKELRKDPFTFRQNLDTISTLIENSMDDLRIKTLEPVQNMIKQMDDLNRRVKHHKSVKLEYDSAKNNLSKLMNKKKKEETKIAQAEKKYHDVQDIYDEVNQKCKEDFKKLNDQKYQVMNGPIQEMLKAFTNVIKGTAEKMDKISEKDIFNNNNNNPENESNEKENKNKNKNKKNNNKNQKEKENQKENQKEKQKENQKEKETEKETEKQKETEKNETSNSETSTSDSDDETDSRYDSDSDSDSDDQKDKNQVYYSTQQKTNTEQNEKENENKTNKDSMKKSQSSDDLLEEIDLN